MKADHLKPMNKWIMVALLGLIVGGFALGGYLPYYLRRQQLASRITQLEDQIKTRQQQAAQYQDVRKQVAVLKNEEQNYDRLVPQSQELGSFLDQLTQALSDSGLKDASKSTLAQNTLGRCTELPIGIKATGTFKQVYQFMQRLEGLQRMSSVSRLNIDADNELSGLVTLELTLSIYNTTK